MNIQNLDNHLRHWARWRPRDTAIRYNGTDVTWAELDAMADSLALGMRRYGLGHGDVVAIYMSNRLEWLEVVVATLRLGGILAAINNRLTSSEMEVQLTRCGARMLFTEQSLLSNVPDGPVVVVAEDAQGCESMSGLRMGGGFRGPVIHGSDGAFIQFTSGTTGFPKGALLTHDNVRAGAFGKLLPDEMTCRDRVLLPTALSHTGGVIQSFSQLTLVGGLTAVLESTFDPQSTIKVIEAEAVTRLLAPPTVLRMVAADSSFGSRSLSSLRSITTGGEPVPLGLLETYADQGINVLQGYGLTENSGGATEINTDLARDHPSSAGLARPHMDIRITDSDGAPVEDGVSGEIALRGPTVMRGYWQDAKATSSAIRDGWLHTGDVGVMDEGHLTVVDRLKDMLISGGVNVYPAEIERVLGEFPGLTEFVVIGVRDERWGEVPMIVHGDRDHPDYERLAAFCRAKFAGHKRPKFIVNHGEPLPRTMANKLVKRPLKQCYESFPAHAVSLA